VTEPLTWVSRDLRLAMRWCTVFSSPPPEAETMRALSLRSHRVIGLFTARRVDSRRRRRCV
jgi:hypothetical protein